MKRIQSRISTRSTPRRPNDSGLLTLSQLAETCGETVHAVRYYLREGLLAPTQIAANGYRLFDSSAQSRLRFVRRAQRLGFSLSEVRSFIHNAKGGQTPCPRVRKILDARLPLIGEQLAELGQMFDRMNVAARRWKRYPDRIPTGDEVCRLIEGEPSDSLSSRMQPRRKKADPRR